MRQEPTPMVQYIAYIYVYRAINRSSTKPCFILRALCRAMKHDTCLYPPSSEPAITLQPVELRTNSTNCAVRDITHVLAALVDDFCVSTSSTILSSKTTSPKSAGC